MRDRETDSWWSIMTSKGIGGALDEKDLVELPVSEKATWKDWKTRHPETRVLSVGGKEHIDNNPYDNYFSSEKTFRNMEIEDDRLSAKASIFAFWVDDEAVAVAHSEFVGGKVFKAEIFGERRLLVFRRPQAAIFESSRAYLVPAQVAAETADAGSLLPLPGEALPTGFERVAGFDTFWYNWVSAHPGTVLLE